MEGGTSDCSLHAIPQTMCLIRGEGVGGGGEVEGGTSDCSLHAIYTTDDVSDQRRRGGGGGGGHT